MLSKATVFVFVFLGVWALLVGLIPTDFITAGFNPTYREMELAEKFSMANVTQYADAGNDFMTFSYSSMDDGPAPPDWELPINNQYLEIWWGFYGPVRALQFRHTTVTWWGRAYYEMPIYGLDGQTLVVESPLILGDQYNTLTDNWSDSANASVFYTQSPVKASYLLEFNRTRYADWAAAWIGGEISYSISYEINVNATAVSAWTLIGQLLTFQAPSLSMTGVGGIIINSVIAFPVWALIAYLVYKFCTGIAPFLSGGGGD